MARTVRLVRSTSQSALLMASLDGARRQLALHGESLLSTTIEASRHAREAIGAVPGVDVIGEEFVGRPGVAGWDPLRIVIDIRGTGATGYELASALRRSYDIHVELATHATIVLILGLDEPVGSLERFAHDFAQTVQRIERPGEAPALVRGSGWFENEVAVPPREAFLGAAEAIPVDEAPGRVSAESIAGYPPGIPALLPGERITTELIAYLRELRDAGARLHGASDPSFNTIHVLGTVSVTDLIDRALAEDVGDGDATSETTVAIEARARATITQKAPGVISGLPVAEEVFRRVDPGATIERLGPEGEWREAGRRSAARGGLRAGAADGRADGAELPRAPLRRGHADRHGGARDPRRPAGRRSCSTRARPRPACARSRRRRWCTAAASTTAPGCTTSSSSRRTTAPRRAASGRRSGGRASCARICRWRSRCATRRRSTRRSRPARRGCCWTT